MYRLLFVAFFFFIFYGAEAKWQRGRYYDNNGKKVEGELNLVPASYSIWTSSPSRIKFRQGRGVRPETFTPDEVSAFVIGNDSFTVAGPLDINNFAFYVKDFVKVLECGKINLYVHYATTSQSYGNGVFHNVNLNTLVVQSSSAFSPTVLENGRKKLKEQLADLFADQMEVLQEIENGEVDLKQIPFLVRKYNSCYEN